jgi:hypothetical protein
VREHPLRTVAPKTTGRLLNLDKMRRRWRTPFATARHIVGLIAAAMSFPLEKRHEALAEVPAYWSRGKGRHPPFKKTILSSQYDDRSKYRASYDGPRRAAQRMLEANPWLA